MRKRILVTGVAGFVGACLARRLLSDGHEVVGVDNLNSYYDPRLKKARLSLFENKSSFVFHSLDISDRESMANLFLQQRFDCVAHLAAQAGVRHSMNNPHSYVDSNLVGFVNILEGCRHANVGHLVFASSSSVYGANDNIPYSVGDNVDHPVSLYAATKKSGELLAHSYAHLYGLPVTGIRFFTVYGPWGRPDMAYFLFADAITKGEPIQVFGHGDMRRDFTYVDDIVEGVVRVMDHVPSEDLSTDEQEPILSSSRAPYRVFNIGKGEPVGLLDFIGILEEAMGTEAKKEFLPMQPGDVRTTFADSSALMREVNYRPDTSLEEGIRHFVQWYQSYYSTNQGSKSSHRRQLEGDT